MKLAAPVRHGCPSAGLACPLGSSTAAGSSVCPNQGLKARPRPLIGSCSRTRASSLIFDHPPRRRFRRSPAVPLALLVTLSPATTAVSSRNTSDLLLRNSDSGGLQVYNISNNQITGSAFMGTVGLDWQFSGVGHFSVPGESDLLLRNSSTGALQLYNIKNDQITGSESIGTVGVDWNLRVSLPSAPPARPTWFCATTTAALSKFTTSPTIN